jgi:hypothetical protein
MDGQIRNIRQKTTMTPSITLLTVSSALVKGRKEPVLHRYLAYPMDRYLRAAGSNAVTEHHEWVRPADTYRCGSSLSVVSRICRHLLIRIGRHQPSVAQHRRQRLDDDVAGSYGSQQKECRRAR